MSLDAALRAIAPDVFQVRVPRSSVFVLLDRRVTLVDTGLPGSAGHILRALRALGRSPDQVERIVITHYHIDHAGGLAGLRRHVPARVAVHALEAPFVRGERPIPAPLAPPLLAAALRPLRGWLTPRPAHVDTLLHDGDELPVLGGVRVIHTPGHTPGHIALHLPARGLLIAGDALQVRKGAITPPHPLFTVDRAAARRSMRRMAGIDFALLALSHFPLQNNEAHQRLCRAAGVPSRAG